MQRAYTWLQAQQPGALPQWDHLKSPLQQKLLSGEYCFQPVTLAPTTSRFGEPETQEVWHTQDQLVLKAISLVLTDALKADFPTCCHHLEGRAGIKQTLRQTRDYLHNHSESRTNRPRDSYDDSLTTSLGNSPSVRPLSLVGRLLSSWALCSLLLLPLNVAHSATVSMTNAIGGNKNGSNFVVGKDDVTWPSGEAPAMVIDGDTLNKYLNFTATDAGFIATPTSAGYIINSLSFWTANDSESRDPASYELYGSATALSDSTAGITHALGTLIASGSLTLPFDRNSGPTTVSFANSTAYASYILVFPANKGDNAMQIADVRFEGTLPVAVVPLTVVALTVTTADTGMGTVTGTGSYPVGTAVTLGATPNAGFVFVGWSPDSCKTGMILTADTTCTATFSLVETPKPATPSTTPLPEYLGLSLKVDGSGSGKVTTDTGLACQSSDCQVDLKTGELQCNPQACTQVVKNVSEVTLTPHADPDSVFSSWGGSLDCIDGQVFMNSAHLCIAYFHRLYPLTLTLQGHGVVVGYGRDLQPMGIDCGTHCEAEYESGTTVYLQATPAAGLNWLGWGGDCETMPNPVALKMTKEMNCEARFGVPEAPPEAVVTEPPVPVTPVTPATPEVPVTSEPAPAVPVTSEPAPAVPVTGEPTPEVPVTSEPAPEMPVSSEPAPAVPVTSESTPEVPVTAETPVTPPVSETPPTVTTIDTTAEAAPVVTGTETPVTPSTTVTPPVASPPPVMTSPPVVVSANFACATTGNIGEVCNYGGREVTNLDVQGSGIVSNGVVSTSVVNMGWVSNFTITVKGKLSGGIVTGYIKNFGIMLDFEFRGASIIGGTLGGTIRNTSQIGGFFQDVTLLANTKITGGILKGTIKGDKKAPAVLEKVRVKKGSHLSGVKLGKGVKLEKGVVVE